MLLTKKSLIPFVLGALSLFVTIRSSAEGDTKLFGIRAGYQMSDIYSSTGSAGALNSFYVGGYKNNKIAPAVHFSYGIEYFQNGFYLNSNTFRTLHTLSLPLNLRLKLGPLFLLGGTAANFKVSESYQLLGIEQTKDAAVFDVPLALGLGVRILVLSVEVRYHWGLIEVDKAGGKNQYLQLGLGVSF